MLKNKRAEGYILPCVMIVIVCMILSVFVVFFNSANVVRMTERNSKTVLESYVMKNSIIIYNSIKQGNDVTASLDTDDYIDMLCEFCTLEKIGNRLYSVDADRRVKYYISKPRVGFTNENHLKLYVSYTVYVPMYFNGRIVRTAVIPMTVKINLDEKF